MFIADFSLSTFSSMAAEIRLLRIHESPPNAYSPAGRICYTAGGAMSLGEMVC
jgi:hypothetical protein